MGNKRQFVILVLLTFSLKLFSQNVPELLKGVWKNSNRYIVFDTNYVSTQENNAIPQIVLRTFYTFYNDRAAESSLYSKENSRDINNTTANTEAQEISINYVPLTDELFLENIGKEVIQEDGDILNAENENSGAWNLEIKYPNRKEIYNVPIAVIGNKLYLNFILKPEDSDKIPISPFLNGNIMQEGNGLLGFWQDYGSASGILISPPTTNKELLSYYVTENAVYSIRYWRTDMDYDSNSQATFSDDEDVFYVPKHLRVAGQTWTCVTGKRTRIRNVKKSPSFPNDFISNSVLVKKSTFQNGQNISWTVRTSTICAFGEPYLILEENKTLEQILQEKLKNPIIQQKSFFPPHGILDFDWSIIEDPPKDWNRRMLDLGK